MEESKHLKINRKKWDKWSETADGKGKMFEYLRKAQQRLIELADIKENINLLDIGCGTGWALGQAAQAVNYKGSFYGVDLSEGMIEKAKINFVGKSNFHFLIASAESIPLNDSLFDIIICTNSFHHYLNPEKAMNEISRLLKPGGKIYILDPTADSFLIKIADQVLRLLEPAHVKIYSTAEYKEMMTSAGLTYIGNVKIQGQEQVHIGAKLKV
jgi:ubiquinone/menaquinone biosynthesis C-methylase UbiE